MGWPLFVVLFGCPDKVVVSAWQSSASSVIESGTMFRGHPRRSTRASSRTHNIIIVIPFQRAGLQRIVVRIGGEGFSQRRDEFLNIYLDVISDRELHTGESTHLH